MMRKIKSLAILLLIIFIFISSGVFLERSLKAQEILPQDNSSGEQIPSSFSESSETSPQESSILEIKKIPGSKNLFSIVLKEAQLPDIFRVIAHDFGLNILVDKNVKGKITASFTNISLEEAIEKICEMNNLKLEKKGNVIIVRPNLVAKVFKLKYISAKDIVGEVEDQEDESENLTQEENLSQSQENIQQ